MDALAAPVFRDHTDVGMQTFGCDVDQARACRFHG